MPPMKNNTLLPRGSQASETSSFHDTDGLDHLQSKDNSSKQGHNREYECVEEDEPGVHVTIRYYPTGSRQIKRVKFWYPHLLSFYGFHYLQSSFLPPRYLLFLPFL